MIGLYNLIMDATTQAEVEMVTAVEYSSFQRAFDWFNDKLFAGELPQVLVTLQRKANSRGYFHAEQFRGRLDPKHHTHEIALNPDTFDGRTDLEILSTLVHEMCHLWQQAFGKPPRRCYHDREWAAKMRAVGLQPTSTGEPGGKETGERVTHLITPGGSFDIACTELLASGLRLSWQACPIPAGGRVTNQTRQKFTCPGCGVNAWAKPGAHLLCGDCTEEDGELIAMEPA